MESMWNDHEGRIKILETNYSKLEGKMQSVETGQYRIEKTVLESSRDQTNLLTKLIDNQFNLSKKKLSKKEKVQIAAITTLGTIIGGGGAVTIILSIIGFFK